jgi:hypothetical protein
MKSERALRQQAERSGFRLQKRRFSGYWLLRDGNIVTDIPKIGSHVRSDGSWAGPGDWTSTQEEIASYLEDLEAVYSIVA